MTSKEQAEELIGNALNEHCSGKPFRKSVREIIPLTELLEVAKAAKALVGSSKRAEWDTERFKVTEFDLDMLKQALFALRATNKINGL